MLQTIKNLLWRSVRGTYGRLGTAKDMLFDDSLKLREIAI
jgi:hypothetical protein